MTNCPIYDNCTDCCCKVLPSAFSNLNENDKKILYNNRREIKFKAGETIFKQHTTVTHIACIRKGYIKAFGEGINGKNILIRIVQPGEMVGGMGIYVDELHHLTCSALTEVECCLIDVNSFKETIEKNHQFAVELFKRGNNFAVKGHQKIMNLTQRNMYSRVASMLLHLSTNIYKTNEFTTNLKRQDLADLCSLTKESLIRILKEFKNSELVQIRDNHFTLLNTAELQRIKNTI
jgi:CRP/FNR family transcriptional regulator